jgi:chromosome partitioning protein
MRVIALVNQKGGVGKSPMTWEISVALAERGKRVIMADFDPQGTLTAGALGPEGLEHGTAEVLLAERPLSQTLQSTATSGLTILAAHNARLASAEQALASRGVDGFLALVTALEHAEDAADVLVCDCPPNLSILTGNVLTAADFVIVPVDSTQARVALSQLKRTISAQRRLNPQLRVLGAILTKFAAQQKLSADRLDAIAGDPFFPATWPVRLSGGFEKAFRAGRPLREIAASPAERSALAEIDVVVDAVETAIASVS